MTRREPAEPPTVLGRPSPDRLAERVRRVARQVAAPAAEAVDREGLWPRPTVDALAGEGLLGLMVPREHGGVGEGAEALAIACEELGSVCGSSALVFGMHCVGTRVVAERPRPEQAERFLAPIARGEHVTTLALSEPGTGVHFYLPRTTFRPEGDGHRLNGTKSFVTSGGCADSYVLSAAAEGAVDDPGTFSTFLVEQDAAGLSWGPPWDGLGMRGNSSREARLDEVRVEAAHRLGREGDETWHLFDLIAPYFLVAMSGTYLGIGRGALEEVVEQVGRRRYEHSGRRLAEQPAVPALLAQAWTEVERSRQLLHYAARLLDAGDPAATPALFAAKIDVAESATHVTDVALRLSGGRGFGASSRIARHLRDARAAHLMSPTTDLLKTWLGRSLLGLPLL